MTSLPAVLGTQALKINNLMDFSQADSGVAYILLVDISKSLTSKEFAAMRQVLQEWIDGMSPKDRAAIITFGTEVEKLQDFSSDKSILKDLIGQLKPTDKDTQLHEGLIRAMELGSRADPDLPARRVIITLSDGQDDFAGGATPKEVFDRMKTDPVPIYAIGYYHPPRNRRRKRPSSPWEPSPAPRVAPISGPRATTIPQMFTRMRQKIMEVYEVKFIWPEGKWDGAPRHLQMTYKEGPKVLNAGTGYAAAGQYKGRTLKQEKAVRRQVGNGPGQLNLQNHILGKNQGILGQHLSLGLCGRRPAPVGHHYRHYHHGELAERRPDARPGHHG